MQTKKIAYHMHYPFILFWLGLLTGALLIALILLCQTIQSQELQARTMRDAASIKTQTMQQTSLKNIPSPYYGEPGGF